MKKFFTIFLFFIYFTVLIGVGLKLFYPSIFQSLASVFLSVQEKTQFHDPFTTNNDEVLEIVYAIGAYTFEPTIYDSINRAWMSDVYEGLVAIDENFHVQSALAISWGLIDDFTWEFKLRPKVSFHDGSFVTPADIQYSIERAMNLQGSGLSNLLSSIARVNVVDSSRIRIETKISDPTLLHKLAAVYIVPEGKNDFDVNPIGTGIYRVTAFEPGKNLSLSLFSYYWNPMRKAAYETVQLLVVADKDDRMNRIINGAADFITDFPPGALKVFEDADMTVVTRPSLEVTFLIFDTQNTDTIYADRSIREAVSYAIDQNQIIRFVNSFGYPATQFTSRGVFGFNPEIQSKRYDIERARQLIREKTFTRLKGSLDMVKGLELLGQYISSQLFQIGIDIQVNYLSLSDLAKKVTEGKSHFYFMGWRSEFGDVSDFYKFIVHSQTQDGSYGKYNGGRFINVAIDKLIEQSEQTFSSEKRLEILRTIMKVLVDEEFFGIPLFEPKLIFAYRNGLSWTPRYDGYVFPSAIKLQ